ncbi:hypothetical protein EDD85DRAFT_794068 [Armillaria nabsnona]|nr:hypothetical protein EDD85DRAFT_794068 [Armillaria nabsnona]
MLRHLRARICQYSLMQSVSSWPNLRNLCLAGDTNGSEDCSKIPPATCALEPVTFERCMSNIEKLAPMFTGSVNSLKSFEAWTMGFKEIDAVLRNVLPSIESIHIGGCNHPSNAPRLQSINLNGDIDTGGRARKGFAEALNREDSFPALRRLSYLGERGTCKTGRGRNVRVHEYENVGAKELEAAAKKKGVWASLFREIWSIGLRVLRGEQGSLLWVGGGIGMKAYKGSEHEYGIDGVHERRST